MKKEYLKYGIFFGGVVGILEVTLGYILHLLPSGISGAIMYPILFAVGIMAYRSSKSLKSIYVMSFVAAFIKLANLALPMPAVKVINPAIAILLEGLSVALVLNYTLEKQKKLDIYNIFIGCFSWRIVYLMYLTVNFMLGIKGRMIESGSLAIVEYMAFGIINTGIIFVASKVMKSDLIKYRSFKVSHVASICTVAFAIFIQILGA